LIPSRTSPPGTRFELPWRAIVALALAVSVMAFALFLTELVRNADAMRRNLAERQRADLEFIEQSIGDGLVVGDYAAVQQLLRAATRDRSIRHVAVTTRNDARLTAGDEAPERLRAPDWLVRYARLPLGPDTRRIEIGGVPYGVLSLQRSAATAYNELWSELKVEAALIAVVSAAALLLAVALLASRERIQRAMQETQAANTDLRAEVEARRDAERAAVENEERFRDLTSLSSDWYWEQDRDLRFVATAARHDERGGLTPKQHLGRTRWELPGTEPVNTTWEDHKAVLAAGRPFRDLVLRRPGPDGQWRYVLVSGSPIIDTEGSFSGYRGVAKDITDRYAAEQALRTAKEAAEAGLQAKNQFLANISHELRTPMTGVLGMTDLLLGTPLDKTQQQYCVLAQQSAQVLLRQIEALIELARLDTDHVVSSSESFELQILAADVVALINAAARAKGIDVHTRIDTALPARLAGDVRSLRQILMQLVDNALKFTQHGAVVLEMLAEPTAAPSDGILVRFRVSDTGVGFDPAHLDRLFTAFTQGDESDTRRFGGLGAGLAIAHRLVDRLGGKLTAENQAQGGAVFQFAVPLARAA